MVERGLGAVTSPTVVDNLSTNCVLTTEWVAGTRLDLDASPDVPRLCAVAINAYLTMLLDTGTLHCDPHPGNLLRTTDGQLCILDWGMTLEVPEDLQYSLIEFIAHVNAEDYEAMPQDFVNLGFTPPSQLERVRASNLTEGLSFVLRQLSQGGGGKKLQQRVREEWKERYDPDGSLSVEELRVKAREEFISQGRAQLEAEGVEDVSVMDVQNVMEKMQQRNRELFKVPPYILYVARAFSTLEGIGLTATEDYSIVSEAFPYLSQRLLTDSSPRAKAALRSMVYGTSDPVAGSAGPSLSKLISMGQGFSSYSTATGSVGDEAAASAASAPSATSAPSPSSSSSNGVSSATAAASSASDATDQLVDILLSADGNYVQELLLDEAAKLADAAVRDAIGQASTSPVASTLADTLRAPKWLADQTVRRLPLPAALKPGLDAVLAPVTMLDELTRLVPTLAAPNSTDGATLESFDSLWEQFSPSQGSSSGDGSDSGRGEGGAASDDGILGAPSPTSLSLPELSPALIEELADPDSRLRRRLPMVGDLSRRFAATLLRRVASRLEENANVLEGVELTRSVAQRAAAADRAVADLIEPASPDPSPDREVTPA